MLHHRAFHLLLLPTLMRAMRSQVRGSVEMRNASFVAKRRLSVTHTAAARSRGGVGISVGFGEAFGGGFALFGVFAPAAGAVERGGRAAELGATSTQS